MTLFTWSVAIFYIMKDYRNFETDDFLMDPFFCEWILEKDRAAGQFWEQWIKQNPDQQETITQAMILLKNRQQEFNYDISTENEIHTKK